MGESKRERAISAAGREIERSLSLAGSNDTLARWMAYRLAELRTLAEEAKDPATKKAAKAEQEDLILKLWEQRNHLPRPVGLERELGKSLAMLEALLDKSQPHYPHAPEPTDAPSLLGLLYRDIHLMALYATVLPYTKEILASGPADPDLPLTKIEKEARARFAEAVEVIVASAWRSAGHWTGPKPTEEQACEVLEEEICKHATAISSRIVKYRDAAIGIDNNGPQESE